ncbi:hypothetical protein PInf_013583 [Phytophthora infestans]|nr:hypothetical protein PInf_013583 [Phytophthora infestans]
MDADADSVKKRKAEPNATFRKKTRRSGRDKSEFVSVEVGMREFKKRLATSGTKDAGCGAGANADLPLQDVKKTRMRAKSKTADLKTTARKTGAPRVPATKATAAEKKTRVKKTATAVTRKKATAEKKLPVKRRTRAATKMTLAEVKAQLEREQRDRVEYRIQTLSRDMKPAAASSAVVASAIATAPAFSAPAVAATYSNPDASPVQIETSAVTTALNPVMDAASEAALAIAESSPIRSSTTEQHLPDTSAAPPTASHSVDAGFVSSAGPPANLVKNEFIADDMEEDLMFAMALEEVERKLATPRKESPPSGEAGAVAACNSFSPVNSPSPIAPVKTAAVEQQAKAQLIEPHSFAHQQSTEAAMDIKQQESAPVLAPEVLKEMERLRRENEVLRRSNELLQAAVTSPALSEAPVEKQYKEESAAHDRTNESGQSNTTGAKSTARYLDLASAHSKLRVEDKQGNVAALTDEKGSTRGDQRYSGTYKETVVEQQIDPDIVLELSSGATSQAQALSMPLFDHITLTKQQIVYEQKPNQGGEVPPEKAPSTELFPPEENVYVDQQSVHAATGSDGDVSDVSMSEDEEEGEDDDDSVTEYSRTSTIDSGNYDKYKVHQEDEVEAGEAECMEGVSGGELDSVPPSSTLGDFKQCEAVVMDEADKPDAPASSEILERTTAPSNSDEDDEDAGEDEGELIGVKRVKRRDVMVISSSSSSESDSEIEENYTDDTPSSNVLEAALKAAGSDPSRKSETKSSSMANAGVKQGALAGGLRECKAIPSAATSTSSPVVAVRSKKRNP